MRINTMQEKTSNALSGAVKPGDLVLSAANNDFRYMIGYVLDIVKLGTPEHAEETGNDSDNVHVDFTAFNYPPERIAEFEERFSELFGIPKTWDELSPDDIIMEPEMLIVITHLGDEEIGRLGNLAANCESYCKCFPSGILLEGRHGELISRLDENYKEYMSLIMTFRKAHIIEMAGAISSVMDAYNFMLNRDFKECELDLLLQFKNPLEVVAHAWVDHFQTEDMNDEMESAMAGIMDDCEDLLTAYPLMPTD